MKNFGKQTIRPAGIVNEALDPVSELSSMLSHYGLTPDEDNPPSMIAAKMLCDNAEMIVSALGIDSTMIGNGAIVSQGEIVSAQLDTVNNRVSIQVTDQVGLHSLSVLWTRFSSKFGLIRDMNDALGKLIEYKISNEEAKSYLTSKWRISEELLLETMKSIENSCFELNSKPLSDSKLAGIRKSFGHITGQAGEAIPVTDVECSRALAKMSREITDQVGVNVPDESLAAMFSLMGLRSEALSSIQSANIPGKSDMYVPYKYFERMLILAKDRNEDLSSIAPGMAIGSYVGMIHGIESDPNIFDKDLIPTASEMDEMNSAMKEFSSILSGRHATKQKTSRSLS